LGEPLDVKTVLKVVESQFNLRKEFDEEVLRRVKNLKQRLLTLREEEI